MQKVKNFVLSTPKSEQRGRSKLQTWMEWVYPQYMEMRWKEVFFLLLAGELSRLKEHSRLLSLPWRSIAKYKAHHLPLLVFNLPYWEAVCVSAGGQIYRALWVILLILLGLVRCGSPGVFADGLQPESPASFKFFSPDFLFFWGEANRLKFRSPLWCGCVSHTVSKGDISHS